MPALIESTVRVTIRHIESAPSASEPATAWVSLDETTDAARPPKPAAPDDRIIAKIPQRAGESPATHDGFRNNDRQYCGGIGSSRATKRRNAPRDWPFCGVRVGPDASGVVECRSEVSGP